jgi:membrane protease YdiL (CAAX protease family)
MAESAKREKPDAVDAARVLALGLAAMAAALLLVKAGAPPELAGVVQQLGFLILPVLYARWAGLRPLASSGFVPLPFRRLVFVLVASLGTLWLLNGLVHLQNRVIQSAGYEEEARKQEQKIQRGIEKAQEQGAAPALALLVLIPPLCEETFFRGILFRGLASRFGVAFSVGATTILFALLHEMLVQTVLMLFLGCYFALLVHLTGTLWASITAHGVNNLAVLALMWIYKGKLPEFAAPWWMYVLSALVFALGMTMLALDRKSDPPTGVVL